MEGGRRSTAWLAAAASYLSLSAKQVAPDGAAAAAAADAIVVAKPGSACGNGYSRQEAAVAAARLRSSAG